MSSEHLDDDALSATLDGEATPEEAAHVESCATCAGRASELRRAANLIGAPVGALDEARRESAIAAALGAAPVSLEARRRRRQPPGWLAAAAVVLVLLAIVPFLSRGGSSDQDEAATGAADSAAEESAPAAGAGEDMTMLAPAPVLAGDLGALTADELPARVRDALAAPAARSTYDSADPTTTVAASGSAAASCEPDLRSAEPALGLLLLQGTATFEGQPAQLYVFDRPDDPSVLRAVVVAAGDCGEVLLADDIPS